MTDAGRATYLPAVIPPGPQGEAPPAVSGAGGAAPRLTPAEWLATDEYAGVTVLDPDGWRDGTPWDRPLDHDEFVRRLNRCTITAPARPAASALSGSEVRDASPAAHTVGANAGKRWPPSETHNPEPGSGGPARAPLDSFERHVDEAFAVGGFPRLVEPAPITDPALRRTAGGGVS